MIVPGAMLAAILVAGTSVTGFAHASAVEAPASSPQSDFERLVTLASASPVAGAPGTRAEPDGSVTVLAFIDDDAGPMERTPVEVNGVDGEGGLFTRAWEAHGETIVTVGVYVVDEATGTTTNFNLLAIEGSTGVQAAFMEAARRDAVPVAANVLPHVANHAHPTSVGAFLVLVLGAAGVAVATKTIGDMGYGEFAQLLTDAYAPVVTAPLFHFNTGYPYHEDPEEGETYRDFPDLFLWRGVKRTGVVDAWDGAYLSRHGDYREWTDTGGFHATAWKRVVAGPATRVNEETTKLPGAFVRQDIERHLAAGMDRFDAESRVTAGAYHETVGESPGVTARFEEWKEGDQVLVYAPEQEDTISLGVTVDGEYVPLIGSRTTATHRYYEDTTNLGDLIPAIESYRVTSVGFFTPDAYVPVFGFDYWGERNPTDLWVLLLALGSGLGDQNVGDVMMRVGGFVDERFVAVAGTRVDDHFQGHRYDYRSMVSAGTFLVNPLDPGDPVPGESPDGAVYVPLVATTYDGVQGSTPWALANANNDAEGMGTFLVSAGVGGPDAYHPLVGAEYVPGAYEGRRYAQETYRVGVFPGNYKVFIPVAALTYDGDQTSAAFLLRLALSHLNMEDEREGEADTTQGVHVWETYVPATGVRYRPTGTEERGYGHTVTLGAYSPEGGFTPLVTTTVAFKGPAIDGVWSPDPCYGEVAVTAEPTGHRGDASPCP